MQLVQEGQLVLEARAAAAVRAAVAGVGHVHVDDREAAGVLGHDDAPFLARRQAVGLGGERAPAAVALLLAIAAAAAAAAARAAPRCHAAVALALLGRRPK